MNVELNNRMVKTTARLTRFIMIKHSHVGFILFILLHLSSVGRLSSRDSLVCVSFLSFFLFSADL